MEPVELRTGSHYKPLSAEDGAIFEMERLLKIVMETLKDIPENELELRTNIMENFTIQFQKIVQEYHSSLFFYEKPSLKFIEAQKQVEKLLFPPSSITKVSKDLYPLIFKCASIQDLFHLSISCRQGKEIADLAVIAAVSLQDNGHKSTAQVAWNFFKECHIFWKIACRDPEKEKPLNRFKAFFEDTTNLKIEEQKFLKVPCLEAFSNLQQNIFTLFSKEETYKHDFQSILPLFKGMPIKSSDSLDEEEKELSRTALFYVAKYGNLPLMKLLIEKGAHLIKNNNMTPYNLPIHEAAYMGCLEIVKYMLEQGVFVDILSGVGKVSAFWIACLNNHFEIAELLLSFGANPEITPDGLSINELIMTYRYGDNFAKTHAFINKYQFLFQLKEEQRLSILKAAREAGISPLEYLQNKLT